MGESYPPRVPISTRVIGEVCTKRRVLHHIWVSGDVATATHLPKTQAVG
jgi:hypothetical protein